MPQFCQRFDAKKTSLPAILFKNRKEKQKENEKLKQKTETENDKANPYYRINGLPEERKAGGAI